MKRYTILIALALLSAILYGQDNRSVTVKAEKNFKFNYKTGQLVIDAERGYIHIQPWEKNEISVVLVLTAKNKNTAVASKDLEQMKYNLVKNRDNIFLNNKMVLSDSRKDIGSIITARYEIRVPREADIIINNKYGRVTLTGCSGVVNGDMQYTDIQVTNYKGIMNIRQNVGDLNCIKSVIRGSFNLKHVNLAFQEVGGKISLGCDFGKVNAGYGSDALQLTVTGHATDMVFENGNCQTLDINIEGSYCPIKFDRTCYAKGSMIQTTYKPGEEQQSWMLRYAPPEKTSSLKIRADFGSITLMPDVDFK